MTYNTPSIPPGMDADERQEYLCLMMEGVDPITARTLARAANDRINSRRLRGPQTGDTRHGKGVRPLVTDMNAETLHGALQGAVSITQDDRTDEERDEAWGRAELADSFLGVMTPTQRAVISDYMGFGTGEPLTAHQVADKHGLTFHTVRSYVRDGIRKAKQYVTEVTEPGG